MLSKCLCCRGDIEVNSKKQWSVGWELSLRAALPGQGPYSRSKPRSATLRSKQQWRVIHAGELCTGIHSSLQVFLFETCRNAFLIYLLVPYLVSFCSMYSNTLRRCDHSICCAASWRPNCQPEARCMVCCRTSHFLENIKQGLASLLVVRSLVHS